MAVDGEVDLTTSTELRSTLLGVIEAGAADVVVDASRIRFIDAAGVAVLVEVAGTARRLHGGVALRCPSRAVRRLLDLLDLSGELPLKERLSGGLSVGDVAPVRRSPNVSPRPSSTLQR